MCEYACGFSRDIDKKKNKVIIEMIENSHTKKPF